MVGVGGQALEVDDLRADGDLLAEHLHALCPLEQVAAQRPGRLEANEHDAALRTPEVVLEVVADAARVAHAGGGDDDLGRPVEVELLGLVRRLRQVQAGKAEHMRTVLDKLYRGLVEVAVQIAAEDARRALGEGAVDIDGEILDGLDHVFVLDLADEVQQLLRAADGERRDDDVAAATERLVDDLREILGIAPDLGVVAVAVGALHEDIVRAVKELRVADDGLVDVADIAREDDHARLAALVRGDADAGRAEQVARVD